METSMSVLYGKRDSEKSQVSVAGTYSDLKNIFYQKSYNKPCCFLAFFITFLIKLHLSLETFYCIIGNKGKKVIKWEHTSNFANVGFEAL